MTKGWLLGTRAISSYPESSLRSVRLLPTLLFLLSPLQTECFRYLSPYIPEEVRYPHTAHGDKRVIPASLLFYCDILPILPRYLVPIRGVFPRIWFNSHCLSAQNAILQLRFCNLYRDKLTQKPCLLGMSPFQRRMYSRNGLLQTLHSGFRPLPCLPLLPGFIPFLLYLGVLA